MHDLAVVSTIDAIRPIEGRDRIEMATIENYNSIVVKGEYKVGDPAVYVFYDSILPADNPDFEFLRTRCYSAKLDGYRIRPLKMGGEISEGLVLPLSVLPAGKEYYKGDIVTDDLRIRLYEPPEEAMPANVIGGYPTLIPKSDEENIEKVFEFREQWKDIEFYITEKIDGTAGTWIYDTKTNTMRTFSHNWEVGETGIWFVAAWNEGLQERMAEYCKAHGFVSLVLQGEVVAPSVQKNIYGELMPSIYIYGMMTIEGRRYGFSELVEACREMDLKMVPVLEKSAYLPETLDQLLKASEGKSVLADVPREGVVWRAVSADKDIHFKVKSRPYKVWYDKKNH